MTNTSWRATGGWSADAEVGLCMAAGGSAVSLAAPGSEFAAVAEAVPPATPGEHPATTSTLSTAATGTAT